MFKRGFVLSCLLGAWLLAGCAAPVEPRRFPDITFMHLPAIKLDVARIRYEPRFQPSLAPPQVGHDFPTPPTKAMEAWIRDRLRAVGQSGEARITIKKASATETKLAVERGVKGVFQTDQAWRYDIEVSMAVAAADPNRGLKAEACARAAHKRTVPEDISLRDREEVWFTITEKTMKSFDRSMEAQIRKNLSRFITP
ncbi:MAG: hypothetical protein ACJAU6_003249 [Alphaproteobacteria bacterium]|jgi:hypothetical protein